MVQDRIVMFALISVSFLSVCCQSYYKFVEQSCTVVILISYCFQLPFVLTDRKGHEITFFLAGENFRTGAKSVTFACFCAT